MTAMEAVTLICKDVACLCNKPQLCTETSAHEIIHSHPREDGIRPNIKEKKNSEWDLDDVLAYLKFGRFQLKIILLMGLLSIFANLTSHSYILTTADLDYRCLVPECESANKSKMQYMPSWIHNAIPFNDDDQPRKCKRFKPERNATFDIPGSCPIIFNRYREEDCNEFVFKTDEVTIVNEFEIYCENRKWELSFIGTINSVGQLVASPFLGFVSDKYGRKIVVILCGISSAVSGIFRAFTNNYYSFAAFEFLDAFFSCGIYSTAYVLGIEFVDPKLRHLAATVIGAFYSLGAIMMGSWAWYFKNWRMMLLFSYSPGLLFVLYFWLISDSIRWLQTKGYHEKVKDVLEEISRSNNVALPENIFLKYKNPTENESNEQEVSFRKSISTIFRSRQIVLRMLNCSFSWFTNDLAFFGLSINSIELVGNRYLNFMLTSAVEIPGTILAGFIMNKVLRRPSQTFSFILAGLACILYNIIPRDMQSLQIIFFLMGKFLITISYCIFHIYSVEMFPTELRLSVSGIVSMAGCIGTMLAPQTLLLKPLYGEHAPVLLFGILSIIAGGLTLFYPETFQKKLSDTVADMKLKERSLN